MEPTSISTAHRCFSNRANPNRHIQIHSRARTRTRTRTVQRCLHILLLTVLTILTITTTTLVHTYNLDTLKALVKRGEKSSYFGYSIAQHVTFDQQNINSTYEPLLLVGAPKAAGSIGGISSRLGSDGAERPGAIYKCDLSTSAQCSMLEIESKILQNPNSSELSLNSGATNSGAGRARSTGELLASNMDLVPDRSNQWLGVSVKSQGPNGYAMACAHRQVLKGPGVRWGQGVCYSMSHDLKLNRTWSPCANRPVNAGHEEYGYCQVGTSCDISETSDLLMGAPGTYTWRGTAFANNIHFSPKDDRTWYMAPVADDEAKVDKYSYLGMSLVSGKFFSDAKMYYASGAPRSNDVGQVLIMAKPKARGDSTLRVEQLLSGEQFGSQFGYQLAKLDFNGDGRPDLVVAAPFYYSQQGEGGRVYLFANNGKTFAPSGNLSGKADSKFGLALANCGDLNRDKYEDLAVGAPYDPFGGSVYIYLGSPNGLRTTPSQVIKASAVASNLQTFGYSLAGGLDMDRNGYPDLAVGSYADDAVFILRARAIIDIVTKIEGNLTRIDPNRTTCEGDKSELPCFQFNTCFELDPAKIRGYTNQVKLHYRIEAETFTGQKYSRVKFRDSDNPDTPQIIEKAVPLEDYYKKSKQCYLQRVYIKDRTDIQTPINFKLTFFLAPTQAGPAVAPLTSTAARSSSTLYSSSRSVNLNGQTISSASSSSSTSGTGSSNQVSKLSPPIPILNQDEAERVFSAKFLKDCGSNDICESHLDVDGSLAMPNETLGLNEVSYPTEKQINVTIRASNNGEPAYEAKLFVSHPASLVYSGFRASKQVRIVECASLEKNLVKCDLGNPMTKGTSKLMMIFSNPQNLAGTFDFDLMVNTTSQNSKDAKNSYDLSGTIRRKTEIQIPTRPPPVYPETPVQEPPAWLILISILLGLILFGTLFYCLYVNGFFDRPRTAYTQAATEDTTFH